MATGMVQEILRVDGAPADPSRDPSAAPRLTTMRNTIRLALNADTTPLSISDTLLFKSFEERAREASEAGFTAVNADRGEPGLTPGRVRAIADRYGLAVASGFFHGHFHCCEQEKALLRGAREQALFSSALGQECIFVSAFVSPPERHALAGRIKPGEPVSLTAEQMRAMARVLEKIAGLWSQFGIVLCYHPHAATYIEAPHEIEQLMEATDPQLVKLGPDTGHLLFGGSDPLAVVEKYWDRIAALHLKDVDLAVLAQVRREPLDYRHACARGVWTELGNGGVDFPALFAMLRSKGWGGWAIVETDHTRLNSALESSLASRAYLRQTIGL